MKTKVRADQRVGLLLAGVVLLAFVSIGATVALPASDPSLDVKPREHAKEAAQGMEIFRREGLWYCDASYVRETAVDPARTRREDATSPEDVAGFSPVMLGIERMSEFTMDAESIAAACGVKLSKSERLAVDTFLATRWAK